MPRPNRPQGFSRLSDDSGAITAATVVLALIAGLIAAAAAGLYSNSATPVYESRAVVILDQPLAISESFNAGVIDKLVRLRSKYAALMATSDFINQVSADSGLNQFQVAGGLAVDVSQPSQVMVLVARSKNPAIATRVVQSAASVLVGYVAKEQADAKIPTKAQFSVRIIRAGGQAAKVSPTTKRSLRVAGFAASFAVLLILAAAQLPIRRRR